MTRYQKENLYDFFLSLRSTQIQKSVVVMFRLDDNQNVYNNEQIRHTYPSKDLTASHYKNNHIY